ncbi:MAG: hypothetical protein KC417_03220 [Myxococcales bacterium]|nr:hypothetical protein [Myxococcales bacterium]
MKTHSRIALLALALLPVSQSASAGDYYTAGVVVADMAPTGIDAEARRCVETLSQELRKHLLDSSESELVVVDRNVPTKLAGGSSASFLEWNEAHLKRLLPSALPKDTWEDFGLVAYVLVDCRPSLSQLDVVVVHGNASTEPYFGVEKLRMRHVKLTAPSLEWFAAWVGALSRD